jgi:hypothetical protein
MNEEGTRAFLVDHDRAFSKLNEKVYRRLLEALMRTERFSSTVVDRLLVLDEKTIEQELARDPSHAVQPLLSDGQIDAVLDRRSTILSHVASLIEEHGRESVLFFP